MKIFFPVAFEWLIEAPHAERKSEKQWLDLLNIEYHCVTSRNRAIAKSPFMLKKLKISSEDYKSFCTWFIVSTLPEEKKGYCVCWLWILYLNFSYPESQIRCLVLYSSGFHFVFLYLITGTAFICVGSDLLHWDQHLHCGLELVVFHLCVSQASIYLTHLSISFNIWYGQRSIARGSLSWSRPPFSLPVFYLTMNESSA